MRRAGDDPVVAPSVMAARVSLQPVYRWQKGCSGLTLPLLHCLDSCQLGYEEQALKALRRVEQWGSPLRQGSDCFSREVRQGTTQAPQTKGVTSEQP